MPPMGIFGVEHGVRIQGNYLVAIARANGSVPPVHITKKLTQDFGNDVSVYIGQTVVSSLELEGQLFMVDAQKMQDGRM